MSLTGRLGTMWMVLGLNPLSIVYSHMKLMASEVPGVQGQNMAGCGLRCHSLERRLHKKMNLLPFNCQYRRSGCSREHIRVESWARRGRHVRVVVIMLVPILVLILVEMDVVEGKSHG